MCSCVVWLVVWSCPLQDNYDFDTAPSSPSARGGVELPPPLQRLFVGFVPKTFTEKDLRAVGFDTVSLSSCRSSCHLLVPCVHQRPWAPHTTTTHRLEELMMVAPSSSSMPVCVLSSVLTYCVARLLIIHTGWGRA